jgi:proline iminopeptidase
MSFGEAPHRAPRRRPAASLPDAETLVITGRDDFICGPAAAAPLADGIRGAELVVLDDAGHFAFLEQPEAFRVAVEAFLASASG